jgi:hypothetical protein
LHGLREATQAVKSGSGKASQVNFALLRELNPDPPERRNSVITSPFAEEFVTVWPLRQKLVSLRHCEELLRRSNPVF